MSQTSGVVIGLILGLLVGAGSLYIMFSENITEYERIVDTLDESISALDESKSEHIILSAQLTELTEENDELESEYSSLQREYTQLEYDLEDANENWLHLSRDVVEFREELYSYCQLTDSFTRIFSTEELKELSVIVGKVAGSDDNIWDALNSIHEYVRDDIEYVWDSNVPVIDSYRYYGDDDDPYLTEFHISYRQNLYQPLSFTVEFEQGDCDDQAMLEYAMIKYYQRYFLDEEYRLYLVRMDWEDAAHLTVFLPVQGDNICILDPAGEYQTGTWYNLGSGSVRDELLDYEDYWYDEYGPIEELSFWTVDVDTGGYVEDFTGSLDDAIVFFEDTIN